MTTIQQLKIKVGLQVVKPIEEVYDAIVNPDKLISPSEFFLSVPLH